jgi:hypothetical protein
MNDNKLIKFLIPLIAAVVVFESIVLVNNLEKSGKITQDVKTEEKNQVEEKVVENPVVDFSLRSNSTDSAQMKVGKTYKVDLVLNPIETKAVDGIETYIKYDPEIFKVAGLVLNSKLIKPEISKIDSDSGMLSSVLLIEDKDGLLLTGGKETLLFSFNVTPQEEGEYSLELSHNSVDKKYDTLIVETTTAKSLGWTGGKLDVKVTK